MESVYIYMDEFHFSRCRERKVGMDLTYEGVYNLGAYVSRKWNWEKYNIKWKWN